MFVHMCIMYLICIAEHTYIPICIYMRDLYIYKGMCVTEDIHKDIYTYKDVCKRLCLYIDILSKYLH